MLYINEMGLTHVNEVAKLEKMSFTVPWSKEAFIKEIKENKLAKYFVAIDKDKVVGYGGMWKIADEVHITNIAVDPAHRRKGIGRKIVEAIINFSINNAIIGITLEVRESNTKALNLYRNMGFDQLGKRKNYYTKPKEDAIIMWKHI